jgi:hypothetical protein
METLKTARNKDAPAEVLTALEPPASNEIFLHVVRSP